MLLYLTAAAIREINESEVPVSIVLDAGRLEAAVARPQQTVGDADAFPRIHDKAAALLHALALNHAFRDGNKRTAWLAARLFYEFNNWILEATTDEAEAFLLRVVAGEEEVPSCAAWLSAKASERDNTAE